jgi:hypothetical protein
MESIVDLDITSSICFLTGVCSGSICVIVVAAWTAKVHQTFTATLSLLSFFIGYLMVGGSSYLTNITLFVCVWITWSNWIFYNLWSRDQIGYSIICNRIFSISKLINTIHCLIWFLRPGLPWHCRMPVWAVTMFATQKILIPGCLIEPSKINRTWWTRIAEWSCPYPADFQLTHELRRPRRDSKSTRL